MLLAPWWSYVRLENGALSMGDAGFLLGFGFGDVPEVSDLALGPGFVIAPFTSASFAAPTLIALASTAVMVFALASLGMGKVGLQRLRAARTSACIAAALSVVAAVVYIATISLAPYAGLPEGSGFGPFGHAEVAGGGFILWGPSVGLLASGSAALHALRFARKPQ